jgi:hypothetical protein
MARSRNELAQMVPETLWHEIERSFSMDEARVPRAERQPGAPPYRGPILELGPPDGQSPPETGEESPVSIGRHAG